MSHATGSKKFRLSPELRTLLQQAGIPSRKRNGHLSIRAEYRIHQSSLHWCGGSRTSLTILSRRGTATQLLTQEEVREAAGTPFNPTCEEFVSSLHPHLLVIETGHFCGKETQPHFYVGPESVWLPYFGEHSPHALISVG